MSYLSLLCPQHIQFLTPKAARWGVEKILDIFLGSRPKTKKGATFGYFLYLCHNLATTSFHHSCSNS